MPANYQSINKLKVSEELVSFVDNELLTDTGITPKKFWADFDKIVHELAPKNRELLKIRENLLYTYQFSPCTLLIYLWSMLIVSHS